MEAAGSSETPVPIHQTIQHCIPEDHNLKAVKEFQSNNHSHFLLNGSVLFATLPWSRNKH
jgi:hypothetical protein